MTALQWGSPLTVADLESMPEDGHRYELVDGTLLVTPAPDTRHQRCVAHLVATLVTAAGPDVEVLPAPYDWVAGPSTLFQPDVVVARRADLGPKRLERPPLLVIEVLSTSTRRIDLATKRMAYADAGVAGYWLVDPDDAPSLTVLELEAGGYAEIATVVGDEAWESQTPIHAIITPSRLVDRRGPPPLPPGSGVQRRDGRAGAAGTGRSLTRRGLHAEAGSQGPRRGVGRGGPPRA